ncbi:MAG TPA: sigma-70 family RNA polymerase sigma factor [Solirubrobacterales bacterium]
MSATATLEPRVGTTFGADYVTMGRPTMALKATPSEEARLAARLRERDPEALRTLYERFGRITFGFLVNALGDRAAAEDVQQQVFLEVWQRADRYDPSRGKLLTWVMTIARSRAIDHLRRRVPEPLDPDVAAIAAESGGPQSDQQIEQLAEQWRVRELLDRLPKAEAELLRLRFYRELSQSEIAERDGIPLGTVKTRMFSGLRRLRELIDEEDEL